MILNKTKTQLESSTKSTSVTVLLNCIYVTDTNNSESTVLVSLSCKVEGKINLPCLEESSHISVKYYAPLNQSRAPQEMFFPP